MTHTFEVSIDTWSDGATIPARFAFGKPGEDSPFATSDNISPPIRWSNAPEGTKSFALICHDPDVPSSPEDVNKEDRLVPADLPRVPFYHWVLIDIPATRTELEAGIGSEGITPRGKDCGSSDFGRSGQNSYTDWFAGDPDMEGTYGGYDGPCPPWNDSIPHRYYFTVYALDIETLGLSDAFTGDQALEAMQGHVLAKSAHLGTYSMNPKVPA
ncbi:MAG: YbhB/YbcL family Raf kinase inhibitor-like protein [Puniceicoccaceae bacterium]|nr:MAG: YbhB/YbcL family Raf kinase inhibitor-like protein [Puniceicoccaceae bacterium]